MRPEGGTPVGRGGDGVALLHAQGGLDQEPNEAPCRLLVDAFVACDAERVVQHGFLDLKVLQRQAAPPLDLSDAAGRFVAPAHEEEEFFVDVADLVPHLLKFVGHGCPS
jgi:hypothetical protein